MAQKVELIRDESFSALRNSIVTNKISGHCGKVKHKDDETLKNLKI